MLLKLLNCPIVFCCARKTRAGIAFPSDQGLHIVDHDSTNHTLTSAVGDLHNAISLSAIISPSADGKSR